MRVMRAGHLELRNLIEISAEGGEIRFAGERSGLFTTAAWGLVRQELARALGPTAARAILSRAGFADGWRMAEALRDAFPWENPGEWRLAGVELQRLQGLASSQGLGRSGEVELLWTDSFEAEQQLLTLGSSSEPACWWLTGWAAGYLSRTSDSQVLCIETECRAKGDAVCRVVGRPLAQWPESERRKASYLEEDGLSAELAHLRDQLRATERELEARAGRLGRVGAAEIAPGVIAASPAGRRLFELARRAARSDSPTFLAGEAGVGKELVARFIHAGSERASRPFVALSCAGAPESLLEAELFGQGRGSAGGGERIGFLESVRGGTLFLGEVGDLPAGLQAKLLRAVDERIVRRVGDEEARPIEFRLMSSSTRDLEAEVEAGRFRRELWHRLRVIELRVPALRERRGDILPLARAQLANAATRGGRPARSISRRAAHHLEAHDWPGNVRELQNAIEHAAALAGQEGIELEDLPHELKRAASRPTPAPRSRRLDEVERLHILDVLEASRGNRAVAARLLGIGQATLYRKLKQYGQASEEKRDEA
ncbi:MAG: sigma-54-dependent Fis family transcriptional regulator [Candidatus Eisenbacteria bacterium]